MPPLEHLEDSTNEPRAFGLPSPIVGTKPSHSLREHSLPRVQRLHHLDSSETFPSEHTSIYDAEPVLSEKNESLEVTESDDQANPNVPTSDLPPSSFIENTVPALQQNLPQVDATLRAVSVQLNSQGGWHNTRLDTIAECLSQKDLRTSGLRSRVVSASLEMHARDAAAADSKFEGLSPESYAQRIFDISHRRSLSLNDLDCFKPRKVQHFCVHNSSSSSGDVLRAACLGETYPVQPQELPPLRIPTPPGLPTFGTKEAMQYRIPSAGRQSWVPPWRTTRINLDAPGPPTNPPGAALAEATGTTSPTLTDGLKRLLGITRIVSPIPEEPRRAALPLYLARADDRTFVRGRFGTRHSAHGVGRGQLDNHPFHHDGGETSGIRRTSLDQAIQEIEKACTEAEHERMASASPRAHGQSIPRSGSGSLRLLVPHPLNIAEVLSQQPPSNSPVNLGSAPRSVDQAMRSWPSLTFGRLGSGASIRSQSTAGIGGVRQFVEQGERISHEQNQELTKKKNQRSECANC